MAFDVTKGLELVKKVLREKWLGVVVRGFFEKIPVLNKFWGLIDGYKMALGRFGLFITVAIPLVLQYFGDFPAISPHQQSLLAVSAFVSWFLSEFGEQHSSDKDNRFGTPYVSVDVETGVPTPTKETATQVIENQSTV